MSFLNLNIFEPVPMQNTSFSKKEWLFKTDIIFLSKPFISFKITCRLSLNLFFLVLMNDQKSMSCFFFNIL